MAERDTRSKRERYKPGMKTKKSIAGRHIHYSIRQVAAEHFKYADGEKGEQKILGLPPV